MALDTTLEAIGGLFKTVYASGDAKKQFFNDLTLLSRIKQRRNELVGSGGEIKIGLQIGRNPGVAAGAADGATPVAGKQTYTQTTSALKYLYGKTQFTESDIVNSKSNKGAFANVMTSNMSGMLDDMKADLNRQLYSDGSGILCFATADQDGSYDITVEPYLWAGAGKYIVAGQRLQQISVAAATTQLTANTQAGAIIVASLPSDTATLATIRGTSAEVATGADGDAIGKFGSIMYSNGTLINDYEVMGLHGGVHNTDPIGSTAWKYDAGDANNSAVTNFTGPESQNHDWAVGSLTRTFQGLATASYPWWKSTVYGNGGVPRALSYELLDKMLGTLRVSKGSKVSAIYTTWQVKNKLMDLIRTDRRYSEKMKIDGGLDIDAYSGVPIFVENDCPRGMMFFVDESQLSLYVGADFGFMEAHGSPLMPVDGYNAYNVLGRSFQQLAFHNRNKHGKIIDILE